MPTPAPAERDLPPGLTEAQREAISAPERVLCVLAGAGAGKTRVLTLRVARRIHDGSTAADHVVVCTFSRKAADELRQRLWVLGVGGDVTAGTFHRTALHLLRRHRADRGLPPVVLADRRTALATLLGSSSGEGSTPRRGAEPGRGRGPTTTMRRGGPAAARGSGAPARAGRASADGVSPRRGPSVAQLDTEIGWAKARLVGPEGYEAATRAEGRRPAMGAARTAELYGRYEVAKDRQGVLDLDDLLWCCADLMEDDGQYAAAVRWRFRHLYVDEMQDVNPAQFRMLRAVLGDDPDLFVVGDPHQSVYGWNGADPTLLARLPTIFPGTRVVRLDENHRCSPQVVAVASAALGLTGGDAPISTRREGPVPRLVAHATDRDEASWVAREVWLAHRPGRRWTQIAVLARTNAQLSALAGALALERVPCRMAGGDLGPASDIRPDGGTAQPGAAAGGHDDPGTRGADGPAGDGGGIDGGGAASHGGGIDGDGTAGDGDGTDGAPDDRSPADAVVLTTFHRAKGLQWPAVFVVGLSDGLVPIRSARTPAAREEERRLLYVALTRAEDELACTWAEHRDADERESGAPPRRPSPWLEEMALAQAALDADAVTTGPRSVASHLADLRARLETSAQVPR